MSEVSNPSPKSYLFLFVAIFGWGFSSSFVEFGLKYLTPFPFLFYRFFIAVLILTPYALLYKRSEISNLLKNKFTWLVAFFEAMGLTLQYLGQERAVPAGLAALLTLLFILIVPFISPFILNEKLTKTHFTAMVIAFAGVIAISSEGKVSNLQFQSLIGVLLLLGAAFSYAFYIIYSAKLNQEDKGADAFSLFYLVLVLISIFSLGTTLVFDNLTSIPAPAWKWLIGLAIFSTIIAFLGYFMALREVSANVASVLLPLQALIPFAIDFLYLGRTYSLWVVGGALLIVLAMILVVTEPYYTKAKIKNNYTFSDYPEEILGGS